LIIPKDELIKIALVKLEMQIGRKPTEEEERFFLKGFFMGYNSK
jgi:hypothetical protein